MEQTFVERKNIIGWGVDSDKKVRPNYPMWKKSIKGTGAHWTYPPQQPNFHDFHSIERPKETHVFGTSCPPKWVSGMIRKQAFKFSESDLRHWMGLLFADRVNVVEGLVEDVMHGVLPRPLKEMGWNVDKKFKTKRYYTVLGLAGLAAASGIALIAPRAVRALRDR